MATLEHRIKALESVRAEHDSQPLLIVSLCSGDEARIGEVGDGRYFRSAEESLASFRSRLEYEARARGGVLIVIKAGEAGPSPVGGSDSRID